MNKSKSGFTIVELLIVIVVIAILAAISVVAYTGIQNRANDTAIKADLNSFAKLMEMQKADLGTYPTTLTPAMGFKFSKGAYGRDLQDSNVRYLRNPATDTYVLMANSKSGKYIQVLNGTVSDASWESGHGPFGYYIGNILGMAETNPSQDGYSPYNPGWANWTN